jgi:hypothetical protein
VRQASEYIQGRSRGEILMLTFLLSLLFLLALTFITYSNTFAVAYDWGRERGKYTIIQSFDRNSSVRIEGERFQLELLFVCEKKLRRIFHIFHACL